MREGERGRRLGVASVPLAEGVGRGGRVTVAKAAESFEGEGVDGGDGGVAQRRNGIGKPKVAIRRRSSIAVDGKAEEGIAEATNDKTTLVPLPVRVKLPAMVS